MMFVYLNYVYLNENVIQSVSQSVRIWLKWTKQIESNSNQIHLHISIHKSNVILFSFLCVIDRHKQTHRLFWSLDRSIVDCSRFFFNVQFSIYSFCVYCLLLKFFFILFWFRYFFVFRAPITNTSDFTLRYDFCLYFNWVLLYCVCFFFFIIITIIYKVL